MASGFVEKLRKNVELDKAKIQRAYKNVPEAYHEFIVIIEQNQKVANSEIKIDQELESLGCFTYKGNTYQRRQAPYMAVDGRIRMMVNEHMERDAKYFVSQEIDWDHMLLTVTFESEIFGKTIGTAKINMGGSGADSTNPVENAQTSALGRALAQAGYGLFGNGSIASAEEIQAALEEQGRQEEQHEKQTGKAKTASNGKASAQQPAPKEEAPAPQVKAESRQNGESNDGGPTIGSAPQFDPKEVRRLIQIKETLGVKTNEDLNEYVEGFGKSIKDERISRYTHLIGDLLRKFNDYMENTVLAEKAAS